MIAEGRDGQIELAVAVEVGGFDVGHARPAVEPHGGPNLPLGSPRIQITAPLSMVARKELAEIGDEQILQAVFVEVDRRHVIGMRKAGEDRELAAVPTDEARSRSPCCISVAEQVEPPVAVEVHKLHVGHGRRRRDSAARTRVRLVNLTGDSAGSGHGSGGGRCSGAWLR